jgi:pimeloyl-ACP methyl ester carboxylesterase
VSTQFLTSPDGTRIAYDVTGSGPPLVLLHGAGKSRKDWHKLGYVERLATDFAVITVDIRGSGDSEFLTEIEDYEIEKICTDIYAVADGCGVQRFAVWGFSFGANIARYLAAWTDRVTALAVIGIPFGVAVPKEFDGFIDGFIEKWEPTVRAFKESGLPGKPGKAAIKGRIPVWFACFQAMRDWPSIDPDQVHCPTILLVVTKNKSTVGWVEVNREPLDRAGIRVEIIEGLKHSQEFTEIDKVFSVVRSFLKEATS